MTTKSLISIILYALILISTNALSANISRTTSGDRVYVLIEGDIEKGDFEKFVDTILQAGANTHAVFIASHGGDALVAMKIGQLIRDLKFKTEVPKYYFKGKNQAYCPPTFPIGQSNCVCLSSCVLIYLSGVERYGDYLGVHRAFIDHKILRELSSDDASQYSKNIAKLLTKYLSSMNAPESLSEIMMNIPSDKIEMLEYDYIENNLSGYARDYQEWTAAKCGSTTDYYASELKLGGPSKELSEQYVKTIRCELELFRNERLKAFYPAIEGAFKVVDKGLIPRRSLLESLVGKVPFQLSDLIGKVNHVALDLLSLVGIPNSRTEKEIGEFVNSTHQFNNFMILIGFDTDATVYSLEVKFYSGDYATKYPGYPFPWYEPTYKYEEYVKRYGDPVGEYCSRSCFPIYRVSSNVDLEVGFHRETKQITSLEYSIVGHKKRYYGLAKHSIQQSVPFMSMIKAAESLDTEKFKSNYSKRTREDKKQSDWKKAVTEANDYINSKFGSINEEEFTFKYYEDKRKLHVFFKGKPIFLLSVTQENGVWKLNGN